MFNITNNEVKFVLMILKSPEKEYNSNSIAKQIGISSMGALKIAKKLEKEGIITLKEIGKAKFFKINFNSDYAKQYLKFLLKREAEQSLAYIKVWVKEIRKIKNADAAILFGSVLQKEEKAEDVDVLLITDQKKFSKLKEEIKEIDFINPKKLHPVYQTKEDLKNNLKKGDKVVLNALKGTFVFGEDLFIEIIQK